MGGANFIRRIKFLQNRFRPIKSLQFSDLQETNTWWLIQYPHGCVIPGFESADTWVMVSDDPAPVPTTQNVCYDITTQNSIVNKPCGYNNVVPPRRGRYVTIRRKDGAPFRHQLILCEVEVLSCRPGYWGYNVYGAPDCSNECTGCADSSETCGVSDGRCYTGCNNGYWGPSCQPCSCDNVALCDKTDGSCPPPGKLPI